ncbi:unnamed protein product [Urochloa humidicola]
MMLGLVCRICVEPVRQSSCERAENACRVGVGDLVINTVLVVQEKYRGSSLDGVPVSFLRLSHVCCEACRCVAFQKSDLFFICMLRPVSSEIKIDETEIQAAKWMPLEEFVKQPFIQEDRTKLDDRTSTLYYNVAEPEDVNCSTA